MVDPYPSSSVEIASLVMVVVPCMDFVGSYTPIVVVVGHHQGDRDMLGGCCSRLSDHSWCSRCSESESNSGGNKAVVDRCLQLGGDPLYMGEMLIVTIWDLYKVHQSAALFRA